MELEFEPEQVSDETVQVLPFGDSASDRLSMRASLHAVPSFEASLFLSIAIRHEVVKPGILLTQGGVYYANQG